MNKIIIDRSKWLRGGSGVLSNIDGKMCCLGFALNQLCSISQDIMFNHGCPEDLTTSIKEGILENEPASFLLNELPLDTETIRGERTMLLDSWECSRLMSINDDLGLEDSEREKQISAIFKKYDTEVEFTNE